MTYCKQVEEIEQGRETADFGVTDKQGRRIGAQVLFSRVTFEAIEEGYRGLQWKREPGTYFAFYPRALRAGKGYGASQRTQYFTNNEARLEAVEKYFKGARARALKAWNGGADPEHESRWYKKAE